MKCDNCQIFPDNFFINFIWSPNLFDQKYSTIMELYSNLKSYVFMILWK